MTFTKTSFVAALFVTAILSFNAAAQKKTVPMKTTPQIAKGEFEVKVVPQPAEPDVGDATIGRLALDKTFTGGLTGASKGQMLGSQSETEPGKGGYVAMERFTGTLDGKKGSFLLQHIGTMDETGYNMNIAVVPGTGAEDLKGIAGKFTIKIEGKKHFYELEYTLPKKN